MTETNDARVVRINHDWKINVSIPEELSNNQYAVLYDGNDYSNEIVGGDSFRQTQVFTSM